MNQYLVKSLLISVTGLFVISANAQSANTATLCGTQVSENLVFNARPGTSVATYVLNVQRDPRFAAYKLCALTHDSGQISDGTIVVVTAIKNSPSGKLIESAMIINDSPVKNEER